MSIDEDIHIFESKLSPQRDASIACKNFRSPQSGGDLVSMVFYLTASNTGIVYTL